MEQGGCTSNSSSIRFSFNELHEKLYLAKNRIIERPHVHQTHEQDDVFLVLFVLSFHIVTVAVSNIPM